jgi:hypothetical protein
MKKIALLLAITFMGSIKGFSQYYYNPYNYNYGISAQAYFDPCVQATIRTAQSSNWVNQQYYQYQMNLMQNGFYNTPSYNQKSQPKRTTYTTCSECNGRGYNTRQMYMGGGEVRTVKFNCSYCYGRGKVREKSTDW